MRGMIAAVPLGTFLAFALGGAADVQRQAASPSATFIFKKSYDRGLGFGRGTAQSYYHLPAGICRGRRRQAAFSWITGAQRERALPAGQPLTLWMVTEHFSPGRQSTCQNAVTFTPRPGAIYEVALRSAVNSHCEINIVEAGIGREPDDLVYDNSIDCT